MHDLSATSAGGFVILACLDNDVGVYHEIDAEYDANDVTELYCSVRVCFVRCGLVVVAYIAVSVSS